MRFGFILTTYDRIDDMLAHLDILKYFPYPHEVIPIWMNKEMPDYFLKEMSKYPHAHYVDGIAFHVGPLLGLVSGIRKAKEIGLDFILYRNSDDQMFNHELVWQNVNLLNREGKHAAGYNWLSNDSFGEFALNELYLRVDKFAATADDAENYFRHSNSKFLCEFKMARWMKRTINLDAGEFYRLPGRENFPGIGYEAETLPAIFKASDMEPPVNFWEILQDNNRWFNKEWQMIGAHDISQRYHYYYNILRRDIPYAPQLEKEEHFARWLQVCRYDNGKWNLPSAPIRRKPKESPAVRARRPLCLHQIAKRLPKRLIKPAR